MKKLKKKRKKNEILTFFLKICLKKLDLRKRKKLKTKILKKYVFFGINIDKILFDHFLALKSSFKK